MSSIIFSLYGSTVSIYATLNPASNSKCNMIVQQFGLLTITVTNLRRGKGLPYKSQEQPVGQGVSLAKVFLLILLIQFLLHKKLYNIDNQTIP